VVTVPKGIDKPYFDRKGIIWLKSGSDKRRVNSKEELRRLFQMSDQFHADELPTRAGPADLDKLRFRDFLKEVYKLDVPDSPEELRKLLQNMNLATNEGRLNLAGVLLFSERPEWIKPQFIVKAVRYPGDSIHITEYLDSEDFSGPLRKVFDDSMAFILRNLRKVQAGRGVNAPDIPEVPALVFEELLVNALVHRDYLISAPVRLFIFDNRIEIVSPGHLPNNLTVQKIRHGNSNIRNPILVSYVAKGLLPYRGLGSGIKRVLESWSETDFFDDRESCLFTATVYRKEAVNSEKSSEKIIGLLRADPSLSAKEIAKRIGISPRAVEKQILLSFEEIYALEQIREHQIMADTKYKGKFMHLGIIESVGKTRGTKYILSHRYYAYEGRTGTYTRLSGISREKQKELILKHLNKNGKGNLQDFRDIFPELRPMDISNLLRELKEEEKITHVGSKKFGHWRLA